MNVAALIIGTVLLLAMIGVSVYGALTLPPDAKLPLHFGPAGYTNWQRKDLALLLWPGLAAAVYVIFIVVSDTHRGTSGRGGQLSVILPLILAVMLASHVGALRVAMKRSGRR
jgi:hypothetical protein